MSLDVTAFGLEIVVTASSTFPQGFTITQLPDDVDPFDIPSIQVSDKAMGVNGDIIPWTVASPIEVTLSAIPFSDDDDNLSLLLESNRASKGKPSARDVITMVAIYPNGKTVIFNNGRITNGTPSNGAASSGRVKTKTYQFAFGNKTGN